MKAKLSLMEMELSTDSHEEVVKAKLSLIEMELSTNSHEEVLIIKSQLILESHHNHPLD